MSSFKVVFKLKVVDALRPEHQAIVTLFDQCEETHSSLKPGDRIQLYNVTPSGGQADGLNLNITKASKIYHLTDNILKPKKVTEELDRCKALIENGTTLADFKRRFGELRRDQDLSFYAYVLKVIAAKSATVPGESDVVKCLLMTQDQEIVCLEFFDRQFCLAKAFPKEKSYVSVENVSYVHSVFVKKKDSFEVFQTPQLAELKAASNSSASKQQGFVYEVLKLSSRSLCKLTTASHNEATQTLKLLIQSAKKVVDRKLEMIGVMQETALEPSELSEQPL